MESCHHSDGAPKVNKAPPKPSRSRESRGSRGSRGSREAELGDAPLLSAFVTSTRTSESDPTDPSTGPGPLETSMCACWRCKSWNLDPIGLGSAISCKRTPFYQKNFTQKKNRVWKEKDGKSYCPNILCVIRSLLVVLYQLQGTQSIPPSLHSSWIRSRSGGVDQPTKGWTVQALPSDSSQLITRGVTVTVVTWIHLALQTNGLSGLQDYWIWTIEVMEVKK